MSPDCAAIVGDLTRMKEMFDFARNDLANSTAEVVAVGIFEYMDAETGPDNNPWIELSEDYDAWKQRHYPGQPMAVLTGVMKDPVQLYGELDISAHHLIQTYGVSEDAKLLAEWFQEGNSEQNRPPRPFYELNDLVLVHLAGLFDQHFESFF